MSRPFFETLRDLRGGRTLLELADQLVAVVASVKATGKPGQIVLKITVKPPKKGGASYLIVEDDVTVKLPKQDRQDTVFFPTVDNSLQRSDPNQMNLGLRAAPESIDADTGEIRTA